MAAAAPIYKLAGAASPRVLLRRLYLDQTGLPPTAEQVAAFEQQPDFEPVVDRLLDSPEFGERWARHWLDLTGYADTIGVGRSIPALEAWRYRDYVINAFGSDKPFDEFIRQQVAGDIQVPFAPGVPLGPEPTAESIVATGFLAITHFPPFHHRKRHRTLRPTCGVIVESAVCGSCDLYAFCRCQFGE